MQCGRLWAKGCARRLRWKSCRIGLFSLPRACGERRPFLSPGEICIGAWLEPCQLALLRHDALSSRAERGTLGLPERLEIASATPRSLAPLGMTNHHAFNTNLQREISNAKPPIEKLPIRTLCVRQMPCPLEFSWVICPRIVCRPARQIPYFLDVQ